MCAEKGEPLDASSHTEELPWLSCSPAGPTLPWGHLHGWVGGVSPASVGQVQGWASCLLGVGGSCPQQPTVLGTPYSAVGDLVSLDFARITESLRFGIGGSWNWKAAPEAIPFLLRVLGREAEAQGVVTLVSGLTVKSIVGSWQ